jgi:hypothetical protein
MSVLTMVLCFLKLRPAVGQGQFSGYRELNNPSVTYWTVSFICLLLSVSFGIHKDAPETLFCVLIIWTHTHTHQLLLMRFLFCAALLSCSSPELFATSTPILRIFKHPRSWLLVSLTFVAGLFNSVFVCWDYITSNDWLARMNWM